MSLMAPLHGLRPPPELAAQVVELPYDVMDRAEARAMASGRPHSFLHVSRPDIDVPDEELADGEPVDEAQAHRLAAAAWQRLLEQGLLVPDKAPAYHGYRLSVGGHVQTGVIGGADVRSYDEGRIRRHEVTRPVKQGERAAHIEALGAQTGPVYLIHRPSTAIADVLADVTGAPAETDVVGPGGVRHQVWPIFDKARIAALTDAFDTLGVLYIADGHHRSAAASMVHARRGTAASSTFLAVAFPADQVRILPYHRLARFDGDPTAALAAVAERFTLEPQPGPVAPGRRGRFGLYLAGDWFELAAREPAEPTADPAQRLDVAILQQQLIAPVLGITDPRTDPRIGFVGGIRPLEQLRAAVDDGSWDLALTLHATTVADLLAVADAGGIMPPKSTWFEPKLLDGLVCNAIS